jgi:hypothetical protein
MKNNPRPQDAAMGGARALGKSGRDLARAKDAADIGRRLDVEASSSSRPFAECDDLA